MLHEPDFRVPGCDVADDFPGFIRGAIIDDDELIGLAALVQHAADTLRKVGLTIVIAENRGDFHVLDEIQFILYVLSKRLLPQKPRTVFDP
jgi:hypothetical protein